MRQITVHSSTGAERSWISRAAVAALAVGGLFVGGCSAILDLGECSTSADCERKYSGLPYTCEDNVCQPPTCQTDQDCRERGGSFVSSTCDPATLSCVPPECIDLTDCQTGQTCDPATNKCVARECSTELALECLVQEGGFTPTMQCTNFLCVDPTWECIGDPDPRLATRGETATVIIPIQDSATGSPLRDVELEVKTCINAAIDPLCLNQWPGTTTTYDQATGIATITGLSPGSVPMVSIKALRADQATDVIPVLFYTQKPAIGMVTTPPIKMVLRSALASLITAYGEQATLIDATKGNIFGTVYDCQDRPAANVRISVPVLGGETLPLGFYFEANNLPRNEATFTTDTGVFSVLNLPNDRVNTVNATLVTTRNNQTMLLPLTSAQVSTAGVVMTVLHLYPRNYLAPVRYAD